MDNLAPELAVIVVEEDENVAPVQSQHGTGSAQLHNGLIHLPNAVEAGWALIVQKAHRCGGHTPEQACRRGSLVSYK